MDTTIASPLSLACGKVLKNRLAKASMTECLTDPCTGAPNAELCTLYKTWSNGGAGMLLTGNVMVDWEYREAPRNMVLDYTRVDNGDADNTMTSFAALARSCHARPDCAALLQISHPGRQCPMSVNTKPVCPSDIQLKMKGGPGFFRRPRPLTSEEILDIKQRFIRAAVLAESAGFDGVEVHAAHGYLLSQFLSPLVNTREDAWGGTPEKRARLLLEVVRGIRAAVDSGFIVGVKLNSADHQRGGFSEDESMQIVRWLEEAGVDFVEVSGGNYESAAMMQSPDQFKESNVRQSTLEREAYFIEFADKVRKSTSVPLMLTGGFRSVDAMNGALQSNVIDIVGLARPFAIQPDLPNLFLSGSETQATSYTLWHGPAPMRKTATPMIENFWHQEQMRLIGTGQSPSLEVGYFFVMTTTMLRTYVCDPLYFMSARSWKRFFGLLSLVMFAYAFLRLRG